MSQFEQQPEGQARKGGTWVYDIEGKLLSIDGVPVPEKPVEVTLKKEEVVTEEGVEDK